MAQEYNRRLQVLLTEDQFAFLNDLARRNRRSVGELVRHAIEHTYRPSVSTGPLRALSTIGRKTYLSSGS